MKQNVKLFVYNHLLHLIPSMEIPGNKFSGFFLFNMVKMYHLWINILNNHIFKCQKKLLGQGFSFNCDASPVKPKSILPPTGRRIHVSSRIMSEILGTLFYFKSNSSDNEISDCMRLLKQRAEYEMYADVILMTESMGYLNEFENQDTIGIEIELAPTIDMVRQKRSAITTRSIKNRQRTSQQHEITVLNETNINEHVNGQQQSGESQSSPIIDEARTNISPSIGPAASTPPPKVSFKTTSPILQVQTNDETITRPRASSIKHGEKKDLMVTVRFQSDTLNENGTNIQETHF